MMIVAQILTTIAVLSQLADASQSGLRHLGKEHRTLETDDDLDDDMECSDGTTAEPSAAPKKCFDNKSELSDALLAYTAQDTIDEYGTVAEWCVDKVTDFSYLFTFNEYSPYQYELQDFNEDISKWNTSSATNMYAMFQNAFSFNQDLSEWDVSRVTNMNNVFYDARSFNQNISEWDVSRVTSISSMFMSATSFNQNIGKWNLENLSGSNRNSVFYQATSFNQDLCSWTIPYGFTTINMFKDTACPYENDGSQSYMCHYCG